MINDKRLYGDSLVPRSIRERGDGPQSQGEALLALVDTTDDAWPVIAGLLREMVLAGVDLDAASVSAAVKLGRRRWTQQAHSAVPAKRGEFAALAAAAAIVYYVRRGGFIKIGTTVDPASRFDTLMPDEILAYEPGGYDEETFRHRQFAHLRRQGEHFAPELELIHHVKQIRALYGDPDPSWPTTATLGVGRFPMPPPSEGGTMTAAEAESRLGVNQSTLGGWVHRRKIAPVGRDEKKRQVFSADQLVALRDNPRAYRRRPDLRLA